jgi:hypothetical protein
MHLIGMDTLLILLSLVPGYHHPKDQYITLPTPALALCRVVAPHVGHPHARAPPRVPCPA